MNFQDIKWTKKSYNEFLLFLKQNADLKYKSFHQKLLKNENCKLIGIRTPLLKDISKQISRGDYQSFIKYNCHSFYEEKIIHGLILGYIKNDNILTLIDDFIPYIDNWAINDIVCANLKFFKKIDINYLKKYISSSNPWEIRFGLVLLLNYYIYEDNLPFIFNICDNIKNDYYYVQMAIAWLISICYIKYPNITIKYIKQNNLNKFTFNKTISKICDSYRVSKQDKQMLKNLKVK